MWRSRKRAPEALLPPCADGTRAHRFVVKDVGPLPDGRVTQVVRACRLCPHRDIVAKWWAFDGPAPFSTRSDSQTAYGFTRAGYMLDVWKAG